MNVLINLLAVLGGLQVAAFVVLGVWGLAVELKNRRRKYRHRRAVASWVGQVRR